MKIYNLTQHVATPDQVAAGVEDLPEDDRTKLRDLLTFDVLPMHEEVVERARRIAFLLGPCVGEKYAMIGGAPFLMEPLADVLRRNRYTPVYAFSLRESKEKRQTDGSVKKVQVFKHIGFVRGDCKP